jgi:hypothetical protein
VQKAHPVRGAERPAYPIASVDKALRLLMLFREQTRVRLSEASEHLGVAHSTAHRLLAMLAYHGFVRQERDSRAYVAGPALVEIGLAAIRQMDIRLHARPVLEDLAASFAETAHLAVLEGASVRYLDAVESSRALRVAARTGATLPANCTASGKAMLAVLPEGGGHVHRGQAARPDQPLCDQSCRPAGRAQGRPRRVSPCMPPCTCRSRKAMSRVSRSTSTRRSGHRSVLPGRR